MAVVAANVVTVTGTLSKDVLRCVVFEVKDGGILSGREHVFDLCA